MGLKSAAGGEIVQVQGGHIIRATGRKDRHSKVFTAKGPRDRRVRLSAHTAIQFYDVQDRLGYDRPSKAVDWLINKAKASIDKLAELPPWDPTTVAAAIGAQNHSNNGNGGLDGNVGSGTQHFSLGDNSGACNTTPYYVPQCVDPQSLGDSMKSFFPTNNSINNTSAENSISFQSFPHELMSRGGSQNHQDLCLSLHTLQDPDGAGGSSHHQSHSNHDNHQTLFRGGFDGGSSGWAEQQQQQQDMGRFTRMMGWAGGGDSSGGEGRGGMLFNASPMSAQALLLGQQQQSSAYSQRGTLQSSYSSLVRAYGDQSQSHNHNNHQSISSMMPGSADSFMGFYIPSQVHGDLHAGGTTSMSNRASSSSLSPDSSQH